jgi:hypothetical protein
VDELAVVSADLEAEQVAAIKCGVDGVGVLRPSRDLQYLSPVARVIHYGRDSRLVRGLDPPGGRQVQLERRGKLRRRELREPPVGPHVVLVLEIVEAQLDAAAKETAQSGCGAFDRVVRNLAALEPAVR